jgi:hypothetical protein
MRRTGKLQNLEPCIQAWSELPLPFLQQQANRHSHGPSPSNPINKHPQILMQRRVPSRQAVSHWKCKWPPIAHQLRIILFCKKDFSVRNAFLNALKQSKLASFFITLGHQP